MSMKVAEAGVIPAGSSNQTNFSLLISEARVALDQRLNEAWPSGIPSKMVSSKYSFYSAFHPGSA